MGKLPPHGGPAHPAGLGNPQGKPQSPISESKIPFMLASPPRCAPALGVASLCLGTSAPPPPLLPTLPSAPHSPVFHDSSLALSSPQDLPAQSSVTKLVGTAHQTPRGDPTYAPHLSHVASSLSRENSGVSQNSPQGAKWLQVS